MTIDDVQTARDAVAIGRNEDLQRNLDALVTAVIADERERIVKALEAEIERWKDDVSHGAVIVFILHHRIIAIARGEV
jgi:hypothetical protein